MGFGISAEKTFGATSKMLLPALKCYCILNSYVDLGLTFLFEELLWVLLNTIKNEYKYLIGANPFY